MDRELLEFLEQGVKEIWNRQDRARDKDKAGEQTRGNSKGLIRVRPIHFITFPVTLFDSLINKYGIKFITLTQYHLRDTCSRSELRIEIETEKPKESRHQKIDLEWLKKHYACKDGIDWFNRQDPNLTTEELLLEVTKYEPNWMVWGIRTLLSSLSSELAWGFNLYLVKEFVSWYEIKNPSDSKIQEKVERVLSKKGTNYQKLNDIFDHKGDDETDIDTYLDKIKIKIKIRLHDPIWLTIVQYGIKLLKRENKI